MSSVLWITLSVSVFQDGASGAEEAAQDGGEQSSSPPPEMVKTEQSAGYEEKVVIPGFPVTAGRSRCGKAAPP